MANLPILNGPNRELSLMQTRWKSQLDPLLANPICNSSILKGINLAIGANVINHLLGRVQQGWMITDITGTAQIYRSSPLNDLTLTLTSDSVVTCNLLVF